MTHIEKTYYINATPEAVFSYLDDVKQRGKHMMGMGKGFAYEILSDNPTGLGAKYHWRGSTYGWKFEWTEVVTKYAVNREKEQRSVEGMKMDSGWALEMKDGGTSIHVTMDYELGSSWFQRLADILFAKRFCSSGLDKDYGRAKQVLEKQASVEGIKA